MGGCDGWDGTPIYDGMGKGHVDRWRKEAYSASSESEGKLYKKLKDNIFTKSNKLMEKHINNSINNVNIDIVIVR